MLEVIVRDLVTGRVLAQICVEPAQIPANLALMRSEFPLRKDAPDPPHVAGRIEASPAEFFAAVEEWRVYMRSLGKRDNSIRAFAEVLRAAALNRGWRRPEDASWSEVTTYMSGKRDADEWKGTTYNRNLSAFRSFSRWYASKTGGVDVLRDVRRADDDSGDGARAATVDEARRLIAEARSRQGDARSKGNRALYWLCLFAAGCRHEEPSRWRWKHLQLLGTVAFIDWTRDIQKNKKHQPTPIGPELAGLLTQHRETVQHGPNDPVFPIVPPRPTFRKDAEAAGIVKIDERGRPFSPQSARKAFSTILTGVGVPEKMVDRLMRHSGRVEHRYYDPSLEEMKIACAQMPLLWGDRHIEGVNADLSVDMRGGIPDIVPQPDSMQTQTPQVDSVGRPRSVHVGSGDSFIAKHGAPNPLDSQHGTGPVSGQVRHVVSTSEVPIIGSEKLATTDVADLLLILGRLLKGAGHGKQPD